MGHRRFAGALVSASLCLSLPLHALEPEQGDPPAIVRPLAPPDDPVTIPIRIDGKGPWNFVVDTGSQRTVVARDPRAPAFATVSLVSVTGETLTGSLYQPALITTHAPICGVLWS
ncbi:pepsin/retropepsin-like aspartic protease family protein [Sphingobium mellinum]|uniref:hypothetical protein n=1 Tax=Sphingobium mellinum TaxID=1387166 RepID=UPI0030EF759E